MPIAIFLINFGTHANILFIVRVKTLFLTKHSYKPTKAMIKLLRDQLQRVVDRKEDRHKIRSQTRWMQFGDRMNKHLFSSLRERSAGALITSLYDEDNTIVSSSADLTRVFNSFYSKLYANPSLDEQQKEYEEELLNYVPNKISLNVQRIMEAPHTEEELTNAI